MTDLNPVVFKLISSELLMANVKKETEEWYETEYPGYIQLSQGKLVISPAIPALVESVEELTKHFKIKKDLIFFCGPSNRQLYTVYADFMLRIQSSFSGIQLVNSGIGNVAKGVISENDIKNIRGIK